MHEPTTLLEAIRYYSDPNECFELMKEVRWPDGVVRCPTCGSENVGFVATRRLWQCKGKHPRKQFTVKVGTIFEGSPLGLDKWLTAMWLIANDKNGISSYEVARALGITQKSAWFMMHRIRLTMREGSFTKFDGEVEVDETFIGGKARNMHRNRRDQVIKGTGGMGKAIVVGILDRHNGPGHSVVKASVVQNRKRHTLQAEIQAPLSLVPKSTPTHSLPTTVSLPPTCTMPLTTPRLTSTARCILTVSRIFGAC